MKGQMKKTRAIFNNDLYNDERKQRRKSKRTSIGDSRVSFGSGKNKKDTRKRYRGQGKQMETLIIILIILVVAGFVTKSYFPATFDKLKNLIKKGK